MRVLCTADLHIGRASTRLPSADRRALSCAAAWERIVGYALSQQVDLIALAGDVVDEANRYYESLGPLERGLRRLNAAGIPVVAVTGNHDFDVLPDLARSLPAGCLQLVGIGGRWERVTIDGRDGARVHVDGWSFPAKHVRESPLLAYDLPVASDAPVLGLLHGDLDASGSSYAPFALHQLRARAVQLWLLGHIHASRLIEEGSSVVLYAGSPQPMDPGEGGVHGAWLVDLAPGVAVKPRQVPLATVRYESLAVDLSEAADLADVRLRIVATVRAAAVRHTEECDGVRHLSYRLRLDGRTELHRELEPATRGLAEELELFVADVAVAVERVEVATRPKRDLAALAAGTDAVSLLARLVRDLESGTGLHGHAALQRDLDAVRSRLDEAKPYRSLSYTEGEGEAGAMRTVLSRQADLLLDALLSQKEKEVVA